jgi:hypothetical protein
VQLRSKFSRYFFAGEMARPPVLLGDVPKVKADWQWSGEWWVTTDAVLTGAWRLPAEGRLALLFVNVSDAPVTASIRPAAGWGLPAGPVRCEVTSGASMPVTTAAGAPQKPVTFAPRQAQVWELRW